MTVELKSMARKIVLARSYDVSSRRILQEWLQVQYRAFAAENGGALSIAGFFSVVLEQLAMVVEELFFEDPDTGRRFNADELSNRTLSNFLQADPLSLAKTHPPILRLAEAFLRASSPDYVDGAFGPSFLSRLGAHTAHQFLVPPVEKPVVQITALRGTYLSESPEVFIPGATQPASIAINFRALPERHGYLLCQVLPLPRGPDWFRVSSAHKGEWEAEVFVGIAVRTIEGLSCHLRSLSASIPLYAFVHLDLQNTRYSTIDAAFATHQSPGFIQEYQSFVKSSEPNLVSFFDNFPWLL